jgi:hypothetical protein
VRRTTPKVSQVFGKCCQIVEDFVLETPKTQRSKPRTEQRRALSRASPQSTWSLAVELDLLIDPKHRVLCDLKRSFRIDRLRGFKHSPCIQ